MLDTLCVTLCCVTEATLLPLLFMEFIQYSVLFFTLLNTPR